MKHNLNLATKTLWKELGVEVNWDEDCCMIIQVWIRKTRVSQNQHVSKEWICLIDQRI